MASSYKTDFLNLNKWISSDKPKRDDFVQDNIIIDNIIKQHMEQYDGHITSDERIKWNESSKKPYIISSYTGNGYVSREISLEFEPSFVIVFKADSVLYLYQYMSNAQNSYFAMGANGGASLGLTLNKNGFIVNQRSGTPSDGIYYRLNESSADYFYIAFK